MVLYKCNSVRNINPPTIAALQMENCYRGQNQQLPVLTVELNAHTGAFFDGFYCHFDHPEQYQTMLLPVKNSRLILTCKRTYYT